jgi:DNA modification methylase
MDSIFGKPPHATNDKPWGVVQHFDVWSFQNGGGDSSYFGRMPPAVVENLLWLYTEPGDIVVDPFAGGGTTIDVAKAMGRRVWASDAFGTGWRSAGKRYGRCGLSAS